MRHDADEPVTLTTARTEFEANVIAQSLRAEGIEARVVSVVGAVLGPYAPGMHDPIMVLVRASDEARAREALARTRADSVDIDWSELDVGDPDGPHVGRPFGVRRWIRSSSLALLLFTLAAICVILASAPPLVALGVAGVFVALVTRRAIRDARESPSRGLPPRAPTP